MISGGMSTPDELPDVSSEMHDWDQFIFSGIYSIAADKECDKNDQTVMSMTYPGVQPTCYAEDIS
jgi:hypothetical protein